MRTACILLFLSLMIFSSCADMSPVEKTRAMYYWNTSFRIDAAKEKFMADHKVERLYVRYFDVVLADDGTPVPNATIQFDSVVNCCQEIIPTVYIINDCMRQKQTGLAEKLLSRLLQMNETHGIGNVHEIQIDCDWTQTTRQNFFSFLEELHALTHQKGITLSATIRLHQLSQPVPPVDCGVLMVYNTGDFRKLEVEKPILDIKDVKPYLHHLKNYGLPMASAFPIYKWELVFRGGRFVDIQHEDGELPTLDSDSIVIREPTLPDILQCKEAVAKAKPAIMHEIILFDINNYNINRYKQADYEKIFN